MKMNPVVVGALLALGFTAVLPEEARASGLELRIGGMAPRAKSVLFQDSFTLYTAEKKDFQGVFGGVEFTKNLSSNVELGLSIEGYGREVPTVYRDFTRPSGREIEQTLRFVVVPTSAVLRLVPSGRYRTWTPYVGVGAAAMFWQYEEFGDFIDFDVSGFPVVSDSFKSTGVAPALVLNAGLRYRFNEDFQITADYRSFSAKKRRASGDFAPNEIDVSGDAFTLGFRLTF
ncbi:MAG: outer membrane beta-barrel protein [Vicinamibacteria bacterium]